MDKIKETLDQDMESISDMPSFKNCIPEISVYFWESLGSYERKDYGTGHELNFVVFLFCLNKLGVITKQDLQASINCIFQKYLELVRLI